MSVDGCILYTIIQVITNNGGIEPKFLLSLILLSCIVVFNSYILHLIYAIDIFNVGLIDLRITFLSTGNLLHLSAFFPLSPDTVI